MISTEIASSINVAFETTYTGGNKVTKGEVESLDSILPTEEVISPLKVGTVNTLVSQFLGTLMLADTDAFAIFSEDKISFHKDHWKQILKAYPANDRTYLGEQNALFLILRTSFQILAQLILMRTQVHPKLGTLEEKIENIHTLLNNPTHKEHLVTLINSLHDKFNNAEHM